MVDMSYGVVSLRNLFAYQYIARKRLDQRKCDGTAIFREIPTIPDTSANFTAS
jgi:hypothetical protein